jgi:hypothetical protein
MKIYINIFDEAALVNKQLPTSVSQTLDGAIRSCCYTNKYDEYQPRDGYVSTEVYDVSECLTNHIESLDLSDAAEEWADSVNESSRAEPSDYDEHYPAGLL